MKVVFLFSSESGFLMTWLFHGEIYDGVIVRGLRTLWHSRVDYDDKFVEFIASSDAILRYLNFKRKVNMLK